MTKRSAYGQRRLVKSLKKIRAMVEATHWTQKRYKMRHDGKELYCLVGFANKEAGVDPYMGSSAISPVSVVGVQNKRRLPFRNEITAAMMHGIKEATPTQKRFTTIENWNDRSGRSRKTVLKALDAAIEAVEKGEV